MAHFWDLEFKKSQVKLCNFMKLTSSRRSMEFEQDNNNHATSALELLMFCCVFEEDDSSNSNLGFNDHGCWSWKIPRIALKRHSESALKLLCNSGDDQAQSTAVMLATRSSESCCSSLKLSLTPMQSTANLDQLRSQDRTAQQLVSLLLTCVASCNMLN